MRKTMEKEMRKSRIKVPTALKDKEQKLTRMLLIIFVCFLLSYGPGMIIKVVSLTLFLMNCYGGIILIRSKSIDL